MEINLVTATLLCAFQVEAENVPEVSENYPITSVPTFVVVKGGKIVETLEGAR